MMDDDHLLDSLASACESGDAQLLAAIYINEQQIVIKMGRLRFDVGRDERQIMIRRRRKKER